MTPSMSNTLIHPNGAVASRPSCELKVQHMARPPAPWGWAVHVEGRPAPAYASALRFRSAEEAWEAGRAALSRIERRLRPDL